MGTNLVFLVPGFLGFESFQDYAYFGDRVGTALRAIISERTRGDTLVVPVPIPPTGSLAERQLALGKVLTERAQLLAGSREVAIHLLGHSTGGVDAQLLTMTKALAQRDWADFDGVNVNWLRDRIKSVVSLASPHQGTCFAVDPVARWFASDSPLAFLERAPAALVRGLPGLFKVGLELNEIIKDPQLRTLIWGLFQAPESKGFLRSLVGSRDLVEDLEPRSSQGRYAQLGPARKVLRRSFVTLAGTTPSGARTILQSAHDAVAAAKSSRGQSGEKPSGPDALFALLLDLTSGRNTGCAVDAPLLPGSAEAVKAALTRRVIKAASVPLPNTLDTTVSDGVVNTVRQMIDPRDPDEIAAVVVGDHFDVIGHYDQEVFGVDSKTAKETLVAKHAGLLHSGSQFRDEQFFELMRRIVDAIEPALLKP